MTNIDNVLKLWDKEITKKNVQLELDEITEVARVIFDASVSIISFVKNSKAWYVSKRIDDTSELKLKGFFKRLVLNSTNEPLILEDTTSCTQEAFKKYPQIKFFAGAPIISTAGNIMGTLSIIDYTTKDITIEQERCLKILAKKISGFLNLRKLVTEQSKLIVQNSYLFENLTELIPEIIFQLRITGDKEISFPFVSKNLKNIHPSLSLEKITNDPSIIYEILHPEDVESVLLQIESAYRNCSSWKLEFRLINKDKKTIWYRWSAYPKIEANGAITWFGVIQDITFQKEYESTLEQISFDISHVLRKPITNMLGLTKIIEQEDLSKDDFKEYSKLIQTISKELDNFSKTLNKAYSKKRFSDN